MLAAAGGFVFGMRTGAGLVLSGSVAGASATFFATRILRRRMVNGHLSDTLASFMGYGTSVPVRLAAMRLSLPWSVNNVAMAMMDDVHFSTFIAAMLVCSTPFTLLYVYLGSGMQDIFEAVSVEQTASFAWAWQAAREELRNLLNLLNG